MDGSCDLALLARSFILEMDNVIYAHVLSEATRSEVEEFGRVSLNDTTRRQLQVTKLVHFYLLVPATTFGDGASMPLLVFLLGGWVEAGMADAPLKTRLLLGLAVLPPMFCGLASHSVLRSINLYSGVHHYDE